MVSICHSVARERVAVGLALRASLSSALSPSFLAVPRATSPETHRHTRLYTHAESIFEFGGHAGPHGRWPDITRILESLRTSAEFDPRIPEVAPKMPRLPTIPFLSARSAVCMHEPPRIGIRGIRFVFNNRRRSSGKKFLTRS